MSSFEDIHDTVVLLDIDGTTSDTAVHMAALNDRLASEFPEVGEVLPEIRAQRSAFRKQYGHLSFAEQDEIWQQQYPGTTSHSQLDIYRTFAPDVFTEEKTAEISNWLADPANFGSAEYPDVQPMMDGLRRIGAPAVLFTLGQYETPGGSPGWQQRKIAALSRLKDLSSHVTPTLPERGKGQIIDESYNEEADLFTFPMPEGQEIVARGLVMVDDSTHNLDIAEPAMGVLVDRESKKSDWDHADNIHIVQSLVDVPALVEEYAELRKTDRP
jgi:hypothetical protein